MKSARKQKILSLAAARLVPALAIALALLSWTMALAQQHSTAPASPKGFPSAEAAVQAAISALRAFDTKAMIALLGPAGRPLILSGDEVADRAAFQRFLASYDEAHRIERVGESKAVLYVGKDAWPLPIPMVQEQGTWSFDTKQAKEEILNRRIGRNELSVIQVCLAYVDAQREYYREARDKSGVLQYAQKFVSSPGQHDGLYWETRPREPVSPLGPLVARARAAGYTRKNGKPVPYHGYYFRILTSQGPDAPGGAYHYVEGKHMIGGYALVAFPAEYGVSGVMTFIVSHDEVVFQKNLGPHTAAESQGMKRFNPDSTWTRVDALALASPGR